LLDQIMGAKILDNTSVGAVQGGIVAFEFAGSSTAPAGNTLARNSATGAEPGYVDCLEGSASGPVNTTANTWRANIGASSAPKDLCSPGPVTTIDLHPPAPDGPGGAWIGRVRVIVSASQAGGSAVTATRCVLDPVRAPARFRDLPHECPYLGRGGDVTAFGHHTVYAASINAAHVTDPAIRSTSFTITKPPVGADLAVSKSSSTDTVHPGDQVTYRLVVDNHGPGQATGVTVEDRPPPDLVIQQAHPSHGRCTITGALRCTLGTVGPGGGTLIQVTATVSTDATGTIVNTATVFGNQEDPNLANNTATSAVRVTPRPGPGAQPVSDLRIQLKDPRVGQRHTFTIVVTNHGPDPAGGVVITFTASLPSRVVSARTPVAPPPCRCAAGWEPWGCAGG
jgi:uncharacterized repeat protein (TIGR01451 family)